MKYSWGYLLHHADLKRKNILPCLVDWECWLRNKSLDNDLTESPTIHRTEPDLSASLCSLGAWQPKPGGEESEGIRAVNRNNRSATKISAKPAGFFNIPYLGDDKQVQ